MQTPYLSFQARAISKPDLPFLIAPASARLPYAPEGFRISYGEALNEVEALSAAFAQAGYGRDMRVALILQNRPEFFITWLALNALGVSIVPINADMRAEELAFQLDVSGARLVVTIEEFVPLAEAAGVDGLIIIRPGEDIPTIPASCADRGGNPETECALLFTSGSTGQPKACVLTNEYFMTLANWYVNQGGIAEMADDCEIALTPLPMFHMNALGCTALGMIVKGGAIVPLDRFHASRWWASVADSGATIVNCLGVIPAILLQLPEHEAERRHSARFALGPGVDARHKEIFERRFNLPIVEAWAMTETGGAAVTGTARDNYTPGLRCIGRPYGNMEYRIVDDAEMPVAPGTPGELLVRTAGDNPRQGFFAGYLGDEKATEEAWAGGWFHTGDMVYADEGGLLYFFDRKKSVVRRSGENIAVLEVEAALLTNETVKSVAVAPVADDLRGEEVFAFVVASEPRSANDEKEQAVAIIRTAAAKLSYHKLPGWLAFVDALPVSSTQKLQRGVLKDLAISMVRDGKAIDLRSEKAAIRQSH